jgi:hypothetical protein
MAVQIQRRGGTTAEHQSFIGANREITVDTTKHTAVIHDGATQGGHPLAREDLSNVSKESLMAKISPDDIFHTACPVGTVLSYAGKIAPAGFVLLNGETIGSLGSGANYMGDEYKALYHLLWHNMDDTTAPVQEGRNTFVDDWDNWKQLKLPDVRGRAIIASGQGNDLTNREIGTSGGAEEHQLSIEEMPAHTHKLNTYGMSGGSKGLNEGGLHVGEGKISSGTTSTGSNQPHNNMPPWLALNWIIKY